MPEIRTAENRRCGGFVDAVLLLLLILLPLMLLTAGAEGTSTPPTLLFWLFLLFALLFLPWLFASRVDEAQRPAMVAGSLGILNPAAEELAAIVSPAVKVERVYAQMGIPVVEGKLRTAAERAMSLLEQALGPRNMTPLLEDAGHDHVKVIALPVRVDAELRRQPSVIPNVLLFLAGSDTHSARSPSCCSR